MIQFIKEKLRENWILKITAIFLAWILWLFIQGESGINRVDAPVEIMLPAGMEISGEYPPPIQVTMRGARQELKCIINLQNAGEGEHRITLTNDQIKSLKGIKVEVTQMSPSQVTLMLEKTVSKLVDVTVPVEGDPADGFEVYEKISNPDKVKITGPRSRIEPVDEVSTEIVDINGRKQSVSFPVGLYLGDGSIRSSLADPISVDIRIGPQRENYVVKDVPVSIGNDTYASSPERIDIQVRAPESLQKALVPGNFSVTVASQDLVDAMKVKPVVGFQEKSWVDLIKIRGTRPSEVTIRKIVTESPKK